MSYFMGLILPSKSSDMLDKVKSMFNNYTEREFTYSLERTLNKGEHFYYWGGTGPEEGFSSYELCKRIEETKEIIEEKDERFKEFFFRDLLPSIEISKKDAARWRDIIHTFFDVCGIKRMGILMYWVSNHIDECDFTAFPNDTTHLNDVTPDVIMKFKPEVIHYIIA